MVHDFCQESIHTSKEAMSDTFLWSNLTPGTIVEGRIMQDAVAGRLKLYIASQLISFTCAVKKLHQF